MLTQVQLDSECTLQFSIFNIVNIHISTDARQTDRRNAYTSVRVHTQQRQR